MSCLPQPIKRAHTKYLIFGQPTELDQSWLLDNYITGFQKLPLSAYKVQMSTLSISSLHIINVKLFMLKKKNKYFEQRGAELDTAQKSIKLII